MPVSRMMDTPGREGAVPTLEERERIADIVERALLAFADLPEDSVALSNRTADRILAALRPAPSGADAREQAAAFLYERLHGSGSWTEAHDSDRYDFRIVVEDLFAAPSSEGAPVPSEGLRGYARWLSGFREDDTITADDVDAFRSIVALVLASEYAVGGPEGQDTP